MKKILPHKLISAVKNTEEVAEVAHVILTSGRTYSYLLLMSIIAVQSETREPRGVPEVVMKFYF